MPSADACADARALFPYLEQRVYLDTAAAGLSWQGQGAAAARFYDAVKSRGYDARPEWQAMAAQVRGQLATLLDVQPGDLTFVSNTTEGLNLAAHSLQWRAGDRIVLAADEFPSVARVWEPALQRGAELVRVPIPHEDARAEALVQAVDPRTRVLVVSQTHSSTGTTLDLDALGRHCHAQGALFVVDGMQSMGAVPVSLAHVDAYAASFFKWMLCGFGIGLLVTSPAARQAMVPAWRGYANMDDPRQLQYAHINTPALYALGATLDMLASVGWAAIHAQVRALGDHLFVAAERHGLDLVTPRKQRAGIFIVRAGDGEAARLRLAERNISVSARGAGVRISPHFYNTAAEVESCCAELAQILQRA